MNIKLILVLIVIIITFFTFSSKQNEDFWYDPYYSGYPYSYGYPYTNCMETTFGKTVCFPYSSWYSSWYSPISYIQSYDLRGDIAPYPYWY